MHRGELPETYECEAPVEDMDVTWFANGPLQAHFQVQNPVTSGTRVFTRNIELGAASVDVPGLGLLWVDGDAFGVDDAEFGALSECE